MFADGFNFDFLDVGNPMVVGMSEEVNTMICQDAVEHIYREYGESLSVAELEQVFEDFDIQYPLLEKYQKDMFDVFDVY